MRARVLIGALLILWPSSGLAFYQAEFDSLTLELRGNVRMNQALGQQAEISGLGPFTPDRSLSSTGAMLRLMADANYGERLAFEFHIYQLLSGSPTSTLAGLADGFGAQEGGRTGALSWRSYHRGGTTAELAVDRLVVRAYVPFGQVAVGRQPINFATTYFFTPNDFFQPFSAQTFFRVYKPGVDAARVDIDLGELSQLTLLGVLGYADADPDDRVEVPAWTASSLLARASTSQWDFEWSGFVGKVQDVVVVGAGLQGEAFEWLGLRVEGHVAVPMTDGLRTRAKVAVGLDHRFESTLHLRLEYFYNGSGRGDPAAYTEVLMDPVARLGTPYLGEHYVALGGSYELTALLSVDAFALVNLTDRSFQVATAFAYSLLDEVDASLVLSMPVGPGLSAQLDRSTGAVGLTFGSELGAYPMALSAELRAFF